MATYNFNPQPSSKDNTHVGVPEQEPGQNAVALLGAIRYLQEFVKLPALLEVAVQVHPRDQVLDLNTVNI